jgi:hypothetical protein
MPRSSERLPKKLLHATGNRCRKTSGPAAAGENGKSASRSKTPAAPRLITMSVLADQSFIFVRRHGSSNPSFLNKSASCCADASNIKEEVMRYDLHM